MGCTFSHIIEYPTYDTDVDIQLDNVSKISYQRSAVSKEICSEIMKFCSLTKGDIACQLQRDSFFYHIIRDKEKESIVINPQNKRIEMIPKENIELIQKLLTFVEEKTNTLFEELIINVYRNEKRYMFYHKDYESRNNRTAVTIAAGFERIFSIKNDQNEKIGYNFVSGNGDMIIMSGKMSQNWRHGVIPSAHVHKDPRISITFLQSRHFLNFLI